MRSMRQLPGDDSANAIVELALVAPILALGIAGLVDVSNAYSRKLALEQGAQRAIEKIMQTTSFSTVEDTLATEAVCQVNGMNDDGTCKSTPLTTANVTVTWRLQCTTSGGLTSTRSTTDSDTQDSWSCANSSDKEARYVQIDITNNYMPMFSLPFGQKNSDGSLPVTASAGMRWK